MLRMHRELVEHWLWWAVYEAAHRRGADVDLSVKTARLAILKHWNE